MAEHPNRLAPGEQQPIQPLKSRLQFGWAIHLPPKWDPIGFDNHSYLEQRRLHGHNGTEDDKLGNSPVGFHPCDRFGFVLAHKTVFLRKQTLPSSSGSLSS